MKTLALFFSLSLFTISSFAQITIQDEVDIIQSLYKLAKKELVAQALNLSGAKADAFWPLYDKYEGERKALGQRKIEIIMAYALHVQSLDDVKAGIIADEYLKNNLAYDKLFMKYFKQAKKNMGALNAAKWLQLESYLHTQIKAEMQNDMPFIFEMDRQFRKI